ncbi:MAG: metallophosphoesterase [Victivallales bacterium]|nr:metallophosphoesterase [Victivallales bacterium]
MKVALISDLHYDRNRNVKDPERVGHFAATFLLRTVHRLNRVVKPDVVIIAGDLIDDPHGDRKSELLTELAEIVGKITAPVIVIPGNHDPSPELFYRYFPRPPDYFDGGGIRFIPFCDAETPGYNAVRSRDDLIRMRQWSTFDGPVVLIQHTPLFPAGTVACPYGYDNAAEIFAALPPERKLITVSGHFHAGFGPIVHRNITAFCVASLCKSPFRFAVLEITPEGKVTYLPHALKLPEIPGLGDFHLHTGLAYCNENMDVGKALELGERFGLKQMAFCEHSSHLYWDREYLQRRGYDGDGMSGHTMDRTEEYFAMLRRFLPRRGVYAGFELDIDGCGRPVIFPAARQRAAICLGAVHRLENTAETAAARAEFMFKTEALLRSGVQVLAHPFRIFRRAGLSCPEDLFVPVAKLLQRYGVAAEVNYHTNDPEPEFFRECLRRGVKISFGSDAHNLYEVGELSPHLSFARVIDVFDRLDEVLYSGPSD